MKLRLLNYAGEEHFCEIPDDTQEIVIDILSGDMVMTYPIFFDTCRNRVMDFYDGSFTISKKDFHYLDEIKESYDLFEISSL